MNVKKWLGKENTLGVDIWHKKYQHNNETFDQWLDRVSGGDKEVRKLIEEKKFLFGGRVLSNRGLDTNATYSNCYVLEPPQDNLESIFDTAKDAARTFSYGGGVGFDLSNLAPFGAKVNNTAKSTSGAVSFMDLYSLVTGLIGQNGRRGALMLSMSVDHPDVMDFIKCKTDLNKVTKANISVRVTDKFMRAVLNEDDWKMTFTREETGEVITKTVPAKDLFRLICETANNYAEPGLLFWDTVCRNHLMADNPEFKYAGTNPCGEMPLPAGGACNLGAINLAEFVKNPFTDKAEIDWSSLSYTIKVAVRALNDLLDEGLSKHPLNYQREQVAKWRQIGLGTMGLADMLIKMGITYGSEIGVKQVSNIYRFIANIALLESHCCVFDKKMHPVVDPKLYNNNVYYRRIDNFGETFGCTAKPLALVNTQLLTIAPTGTLSTMIGVSGGIEPIFANSYSRKTESLHDKEVYYKVYTPIVKEYMEKHNITDETDLPDFFVTARDIHWKDRINMQASAQHWIDGAISSTLNVPNEFTTEDVMEAYMYAWQKGLKGITLYREGCNRQSVLDSGNSKDTPKVELKETPKESKTVGLERHLTTGCGSLHLCAYFDEQGNLKNTYLSKGSTGGCNNFMIGLSRMISLAARNNVSISDIVDQLKSCGACPSYAVRRATKKDVSIGSCCPVAIGNALIDMWNEINTNQPKVEISTSTDTEHCPECGGELKHEMGCVICSSCGYSKCG